MKSYMFCVFLILLMVVPLMGIPYEQTEEYTQKQAILNERAVRFKAETGFTGDVGHSTRTMRLHTYRGNFSGIHFSAEADTIAFRQACESIVQKILPFSPANRMQLSMSRITKSVRGYTTDYYQQVNGYRVEGAGFIMITYEEGRKRFSIGDNTVELPDGDAVPVLSYEEAVSIAKQHYTNELGYPDTIEIKPATKSIAFVKFDNQYKLCFVLGIPDPNPNKIDDYTIVIDAITGKVRYLWDLMSPIVCHVTGQIYGVGANDFTNPVTAAMDSVEVQNANAYYYSSDDGWCTVIDLPHNEITSRLKLRESYFLTIHPDTEVADTKVADYISSPELGSISIGYDTDDACSANVYYHVIKQHIGLNNLSLFQPNNLRLTVGIPTSSMTAFGTYSASANLIRIREDKGQYSHVIRHELSHAFMFQMLSNNWFRNGDYDEFYACMDESIAHFFACSVSNSPNAVMGLSSGQAEFENISNINADRVKEFFWPMFTLNEDLYTFRYFDYALASAWWSLRSDPEYSPTAVDNLLIAGLKRVSEEIIPNSAYRYKPRYFYNILMDLVDDGSAAGSLNPKQFSINKAYESRGFYFTPKVESFSEGNRSRNVYSLGDQVHAKITKAPQNTAFTVYVIRHGVFTYLDGANVSSLAPYYATDFTPITGNSTDAGGNWDGLVWTIPAEAGNVDGGYDIIVDFGSPEAPDNQFHFTYTAANVMDGFDGLHKPGFTVVDDRIDVLTLASELNASPLSR